MTINRRQLLTNELGSWPGVTVKPHRFGGIEFLFEENEIGHLHGDYLVDLLFPKPIRDEIVGAGRAVPHHMHPESGWISVYLKTDTDITNAVELLRLKYQYLIEKRK